MRESVVLFLITLLICSCQKGDPSISDELIGDWTYSNRLFANDPNVQMTFNVGPDHGLMSFDCDGSGQWKSNSFYSENDEVFKMNWVLDTEEQNITLNITKHIFSPPVMHPGDYNVTRIDKFNYIFKKEYTFDDNPNLIVTNEIRLERSN